MNVASAVAVIRGGSMLQKMFAIGNSLTGSSLCTG